MRTKMTFLLSAALLFAATEADAGLEQMEVYGTAEVYYLGLVKVYDATLYVDDRPHSRDILSPYVSKCLELSYHVSLEPEDFVGSAEKVLSRQFTEARLHEFRPQIDKLHASYKPVRKGDRYRLCYEAGGETTRLALNNKELVAITSKEFGSVYFGIWLNPVNPLDASLQEDLLAGPAPPTQE